MSKAEKTFSIIAAVFIAWIVLSYFNVVLHNQDPNYTYPALNFFKLLFEK